MAARTPIGRWAIRCRRRTREYWSETSARPPDWPQKNFSEICANRGRSRSHEPMSSLRATHQRQVIVSERIQSHQARAILGISLRSVQNLAARGVLPSAAQYARDWTFDEEGAASATWRSASKPRARRQRFISKPRPPRRSPSIALHHTDRKRPMSRHSDSSPASRAARGTARLNQPQRNRPRTTTDAE